MAEYPKITARIPLSMAVELLPDLILLMVVTSKIMAAIPDPILLTQRH